MLTVTSFHGFLLKLTSTPPEMICTKPIIRLAAVAIKMYIIIASIVLYQ